MIDDGTSSSPTSFLRLLAHELRWQLITALTRSDYRVQELIAVLRQPANLVSYHLGLLREAQLVTERRSDADGRDVYYHLDLDRLRTHYASVGAALHPTLMVGQDTAVTSLAWHPRVLFLCTHNSARSQMAEAIMRNLSHGEVEVASAGSEPATVHPLAVETMTKVGLDIRHHESKHLERFRDQSFDYIVTVCDNVREICPSTPSDAARVHWSIPDPAACADSRSECQRVFGQTAIQIATRVGHLLQLIAREQNHHAATRLDPLHR